MDSYLIFNSTENNKWGKSWNSYLKEIAENCYNPLILYRIYRCFVRLSVLGCQSLSLQSYGKHRDWHDLSFLKEIINIYRDSEGTKVLLIHMHNSVHFGVFFFFYHRRLILTYSYSYYTSFSGSFNLQHPSAPGFFGGVALSGLTETPSWHTGQAWHRVSQDFLSTQPAILLPRWTGFCRIQDPTRNRTHPSINRVGIGILCLPHCANSPRSAWVCGSVPRAEGHASTPLPQSLLGLTLYPWWGKIHHLWAGTVCDSLHSGDFCELLLLSSSGYQFSIGTPGVYHPLWRLSDCRAG